MGLGLVDLMEPMELMELVDQLEPMELLEPMVHLAYLHIYWFHLEFHPIIHIKDKRCSLPLTIELQQCILHS